MIIQTDWMSILMTKRQVISTDAFKACLIFHLAKFSVIKSNCQVPNSFFCYKYKFYLPKIEFCKIEKEDNLITLLSA